MSHPVTSKSAVVGCALALVLLSGAMVLPGQASAETTVSNIVITPSSPAALEYDTHVEITFDYTTDVPGGVWIGFLPRTNGSPTPGSYFSGGPHYPVGSGSGSWWFSVGSGSDVVDAIQVELQDTSDVVLDSFILPATFAFGESGTITNIVITPSNPATVMLGEQVQIIFDYTTPEPAYIRFQPFSSDAYAAGGQDSGYNVASAGSGSGSTTFTVTGAALEVDQLQVTMQPVTPPFLVLFKIPVSYTFDQTTPVLPITWGRAKQKYMTSP